MLVELKQKYSLAGDQPPENHPGGRQDGRITWICVGGGRIALKACAWVSVGEAQTWCGRRGHSFFVVEDAVALAVSECRGMDSSDALCAAAVGFRRRRGSAAARCWSAWDAGRNFGQPRRRRRREQCLLQDRGCGEFEGLINGVGVAR